MAEFAFGSATWVRPIYYLSASFNLTRRSLAMWADALNADFRSRPAAPLALSLHLPECRTP